MNSANGPWPPLIVAERIPRLVKWRDVLITLIMWLCFAVLLGSEFKLFLGDYLERLGLGDFDTNPDWPAFLERLMPFVLTAVILAAVLVIFSLQTLQNRSRALLLPQHPPLEAAEQARHVGMDQAALIAARDQAIVIVHIDADGTHRIGARPASGP